ncbi:MAG: serine hydrolase [Clostridiales bacterium]|nr:serine hydrolase [Clostridiales bacterium]
MARVLDRAVILDRLSRVPGTVGFYYKDLLTGEELCLNENEEYEAASVIKLPMFAAAAKLVSEGRASWEDKLLCKAEDRVPSCGVLRFFDDGIEVSLKTLCALMITISDNMATNIIMRHFGIDRLNAEFKAMGLEKTHIERLLFDSAAGAAGKQNKIVPKEMGMLLEQVWRHEFIDEATSKVVEDILLEQQINHKIPGYLPGHIDVAHKTGEDSGITNDVAVVCAKEPFVLCIATNRTDVPEAERAMREIALMLVGDEQEEE